MQIVSANVKVICKIPNPKYSKSQIPNPKISNSEPVRILGFGIWDLFEIYLGFIWDLFGIWYLFMKPVSEDDFPEIEAEMKKIIKAKIPFVRKTVSKSEFSHSIP